MHAVATLVFLLAAMPEGRSDLERLPDPPPVYSATASGDGLAVVGPAREAMVLVEPQPAPAYPFRLHTKYRYLLHRGAYYQRSNDYHRLFDYPWHASPTRPVTPWMLSQPVGP